MRSWEGLISKNDGRVGGLCEGCVKPSVKVVKEGYVKMMMHFLAVMGVESVMEDVADDLKPLNLWCCSL